jgi:hypothetical protein
LTAAAAKFGLVTIQFTTVGASFFELYSALVAESGVGTILRLASMADHDRATVRRAYSSADIGKQAGISSDMGSPVEYVAIKSLAFTTARVKLLSKWRVPTELLNDSAD